jgi:hypothetical protein
LQIEENINVDDKGRKNEKQIEKIASLKKKVET